MGDFSQNGIISSLHDFGTKSTKDIEKDLLKFSKERKMELILPSLYSELEGDALPKIVNEISKINYISHVIIGLDKANRKQADKAHRFFKKLKTNLFFVASCISINRLGLYKDKVFSAPSKTSFSMPSTSILIKSMFGYFSSSIGITLIFLPVVKKVLP